MKPLSRILQEIDRHDDEGRQRVRDLYAAIQATDRRGEITRQASLIAAPFGKGRPFERTTLKDIGNAHSLLWMAYSLLDHLLDGDEPLEALGLAITLHRLSLTAYLGLGLGSDLIHAQYRRLDRANRYELRHLRLIQREDGIVLPHLLPSRPLIVRHIEERTAAHLLPGLLVLHHAQIDPSARQALIQALHRYAVARQLSDDLHDWVDDLRGGRLTYVVRELFVMEGVAEGLYPLDDLVAALKRRFFYGGMKEMLETIERLVVSSRAVFEEHFGTDSPFARAILDPLTANITAALQKHADDRALLATKTA